MATKKRIFKLLKVVFILIFIFIILRYTINEAIISGNYNKNSFFSFKKINLFIEKFSQRELAKECRSGGAKLKYFNSGCGDDCNSIRQNDIGCTQAMSWDCDCGSDMCWNGSYCEPNYSNALKEKCELGGAIVERFYSDSDECEYLKLTNDKNITGLRRAFLSPENKNVFQCACEAGECWDGDTCVKIENFVN